MNFKTVIVDQVDGLKQRPFFAKVDTIAGPVNVSGSTKDLAMASLVIRLAGMVDNQIEVARAFQAQAEDYQERIQELEEVLADIRAMVEGFDHAGA